MKSKIFFLIIIIFGHYFVQSQNTDSLLIGRWLATNSDNGDEIEYHFNQKNEFSFYLNGRLLSTIANVTNGDTAEASLIFRIVYDSNQNEEIILIKQNKNVLFRLEILSLARDELCVKYYDPLLKRTTKKTFQRINFEDSP